jgi:hypothetical protein
MQNSLENKAIILHNIFTSQLIIQGIGFQRWCYTIGAPYKSDTLFECQGKLYTFNQNTGIFEEFFTPQTTYCVLPVLRRSARLKEKEEQRKTEKWFT